MRGCTIVVALFVFAVVGLLLAAWFSVSFIE